jgi:superfamily I DNA/RNA helicase
LKLIKEGRYDFSMSRDFVRQVNGYMGGYKKLSLSEAYEKLSNRKEDVLQNSRNRRAGAAQADMIEAIMLLIDACTEDTIKGFLNWIERIFPDSKLKANLYLSTIHSAKGMEADNVVWLGGADYKPWSDDQEDTIHLPYVAVTRAKKNLYLL